MSTPEKHSDLVGSQAGLGAAVATETGAELGELEDVRARGYWELVWRRFRRDRVAIASGVFIVLLVLVAFAGAPIAKHYVKHGPNDLFPPGCCPGSKTDPVSLGGVLPANPWAKFKNPATGDQPYPEATDEEQVLVLGAANRLGQDEFLRLLYGARVSLEVAGLSTLGVMLIGVFLGAVAGYFRGWIDTIISRVTEITMAFPVLIFVISLAATVGPRLDSVTLGLFPQGVITLVLIFTLFGWYYPARIMRAQVLSIREKEYVEAARMIGASDLRIIRSHVLPHLIAPMIVYSTLIVASFVLFEAGLSFLGLGIKPPESSWGNLLATAPEYYTKRPLLMLWPGLAVLMATLAFNLLGDGLRDAFDPRGHR
jgi:peptide/nickel transport system permease protein